MQTHMHTHAHAHIHIHTHMHVHTYTHTHTHIRHGQKQFYEASRVLAFDWHSLLWFKKTFVTYTKFFNNDGVLNICNDENYNLLEYQMK